MMLKHADIWAAIDRLAQDKGMSPSGLARSAGLDPTTFNRSKRVTRDGKPRWPSTESIAKILIATETTFPAFVKLVNRTDGFVLRRTIRLTSLSNCADATMFSATGEPNGDGWDELPMPEVDSRAYAVEVSSSEYEPAYRDGDILIVSAFAVPRRGDRILIRTVKGAVSVGQFQRQTAKRLDFKGLDGSDRASLPLEEVRGVARILWVSQ